MELDNETLIDDNLLDLVKRLKKLTGSNPMLSWIASAEAWYIQIYDWLSMPISITYVRINKKKFSIFIYSAETYTEMGHVEHPSQVADSLEILKLKENGLSNEVVKYLSNKISSFTLKTVIKNISTDKNITLTNEDLEILKISRTGKNQVVSRRFGI